MLSRFFYSEACSPSYFENDDQLNKLDNLLNKLRNKVKELKQESEQSRTDYVTPSKYRVMSALLTAIDQRIEQFKQIAQPPSTDDKLTLLNDLMGIIKNTYDQHYATLHIKRNNNREIADGALKTFVEGGTNVVLLSVGLAYPLPGVVLGPFSYFYAAPRLSAKARKATGLDDQETASNRLLTESFSVILELRNNLYKRSEDNDKVSSAADAAASYSV